MTAGMDHKGAAERLLAEWELLGTPCAEYPSPKAALVRLIAAALSEAVWVAVEKDESVMLRIKKALRMRSDATLENIAFMTESLRVMFDAPMPRTDAQATPAPEPSHEKKDCGDDCCKECYGQ